MSSVITAVGTFGGLTLVLVYLLILANKKLYVYEDPRIDEVEDRLPHANCGACKYPGCRQFAEALVSQKAQPGGCTVSSEEDKKGIAAFLGVDVGAQDKIVARLACAGGHNVARNRVTYSGLQTCRAVATIAGGNKDCVWGCLGLADCETVCTFDAISMEKNGLPVVNIDLCTACNDCVEVCPKQLFSLHSVKHKLWVACKNLDSGDEVLEGCEVGCTACGKCEMDSPAGLVTIKSNLPEVNYENKIQTKIPIERCPTGAIVWLDNKNTIKGLETKKVIRKSPRPILPLSV